jgi:hypothetical protein
MSKLQVFHIFLINFVASCQFIGRIIQISLFGANFAPIDSFLGLLLFLLFGDIRFDCNLIWLISFHKNCKKLIGPFMILIISEKISFILFFIKISHISQDSLYLLTIFGLFYHNDLFFFRLLFDQLKDSLHSG